MIATIARRGRHATISQGEQAHDFLVARLTELLVPEADGIEWFRGREADVHETIVQ